MRIGMLTEGGYPYVSGDARLWCDRLVRGLGQHEFHVYALSRSEDQEAGGWLPLPPQVTRVRTAPLWTAGSGGVGGAGGAGGGGEGEREALRGAVRGAVRKGVREGWCGRGFGRRARRRFAEVYGELAGVVCAGGADVVSGGRVGVGEGESGGFAGRVGVRAGEPGGFAGRVGLGEGVPEGSALLADRFAYALYGLADLARDEGGGLEGALRSETAVRALERACRAPGAQGSARGARVPDLLTVAAHLERALRPLSLDWYEDDALGAVDLCHAASGGIGALPGLLARHFTGVPLVVTEYGVQLRTHYLASGADAAAPAVRALLAGFHGRLAAEVYRRAAVVTHGNAYARRWQERCGAERGKVRTVYPGMDVTAFGGQPEAVGGGCGVEGGCGCGGECGVGCGGEAGAGDPGTLVWVGRVAPAKDLVSLLHAFAEVRRVEPGARLRVVSVGDPETGADAYLAHCRALAAQLFPDEAAGPHVVGENPVSFEGIGGPDLPTPAAAYASGAVVVLSSVVEGFPVGLVEAMLGGRATVSTDVGAVVEVIGGTGLVVPPRNPRALAEACVALLRDPARRTRLEEAARARALELFSVEQNIAAFHGIYLEVVFRCPVRRVVLDAAGEPLPFAYPAEAHVPGHWTDPSRRPAPRPVPAWAAGPPVRGTAMTVLGEGA
ncbi:DUF3492 domain-containing protein [Streptomyces sp. NPDC004610]|uniref:DUF3492 domain-containing protein n=1 Tax=unclassified Streptomyces TaxID=2593676 RepID=UPI0033B4B8C4